MLSTPPTTRISLIVCRPALSEVLAEASEEEEEVVVVLVVLEEEFEVAVPEVVVDCDTSEEVFGEVVVEVVEPFSGLSSASLAAKTLEVISSSSTSTRSGPPEARAAILFFSRKAFKRVILRLLSHCKEELELEVVVRRGK